MRSGLTRRSLLLGGAGTLSIASQAQSNIAAVAHRFASSRKTVVTGLIPQGSEANLAPIVDAWERATGIPVALQVVPVDDVHLQINLGALSGKTQPDFALPATFAVPDLAEGGVIVPHDALARDAGLAVVDTHDRSGIGDYFDGQRFGMQTDGDVYLMFYRADLREADRARYENLHGTPLVQPATWPELDRQMAFFHHPEAGRFGGMLFRTPGYLVWEFWARLHAKGALPFDRDLEPCLHGDEGIAALEEMVAATASLHPATASADLFENWELFQKTETYCNIGWGGSQKTFNAPGSPLRGKLSYSRLPGELRAHSSYFNWGWSYVVPATARHPELGHLFASFAIEPAQSTDAIRAVDGYFDPFLDTHYDDARIREIYSVEFLKTHREALNESIPDLYLPGHGAFVASLSRAIQDTISGRTTARHALTKTSEAWQVGLLDHDRDRLLRQWNAILDRYPQSFVTAI